MDRKRCVTMGLRRSPIVFEKSGSFRALLGVHLGAFEKGERSRMGCSEKGRVEGVFFCATNGHGFTGGMALREPLALEFAQDAADDLVDLLAIDRGLAGGTAADRLVGEAFFGENALERVADALQFEVLLRREWLSALPQIKSPQLNRRAKSLGKVG